MFFCSSTRQTRNTNPHHHDNQLQDLTWQMTTVTAISASAFLFCRIATHLCHFASLTVTFLKQRKKNIRINQIILMIWSIGAQGLKQFKLRFKKMSANNISLVLRLPMVSSALQQCKQLRYFLFHKCFTNKWCNSNLKSQYADLFH